MKKILKNLHIIIEVTTFFIIAFFLKRKGLLQSNNLIDYTIIFSAFLYFSIHIISESIRNFFEKRHEEENKLEQDNRKIILRYFGENFITYNNSNDSISKYIRNRDFRAKRTILRETIGTKVVSLSLFPKS